MTRLPAITARAMLAALKRAGFLEDRQSGSHVVLRHPVTLRRAVVPMHRGDLKRPTAKAILEQAGLSEGQIRDLL